VPSNKPADDSTPKTNLSDAAIQELLAESKRLREESIQLRKMAKELAELLKNNRGK
jgi:hypothetical protein